MWMVFHETLPEFMTFFGIAFAVEVVVEEQCPCGSVRALVFEDGSWGLEEYCFWIYQDDLFEGGCERGEGAERRGGIRSFEIGWFGIEKSWDVDGCDVRCCIYDKAA